MKRKDIYNYFQNEEYTDEDSPYDFSAVDLRGDKNTEGFYDDMEAFSFDDDSYGDLPFDEDEELVEEDFSLRDAIGSDDEDEESFVDNDEANDEMFVLDPPDEINTEYFEYDDESDDGDQDVAIDEKEEPVKDVQKNPVVPVITNPVFTGVSSSAALTGKIVANTAGMRSRNSALQPLLVINRSKHSFDPAKKKTNIKGVEPAKMNDSFDDFADEKFSVFNEDDIEDVSETICFDEATESSTAVENDENVEAESIAEEIAVDTVDLTSEEITDNGAEETIDSDIEDVSESAVENYTDDTEEMTEESNIEASTEKDTREDITPDENYVDEVVEVVDDSDTDTDTDTDADAEPDTESGLYSDEEGATAEDVISTATMPLFDDDLSDLDMDVITSEIDDSEEKSSDLQKKNGKTTRNEKTDAENVTYPDKDVVAEQIEETENAATEEKKIARKKRRRKKKVKNLTKEILSWTAIVIAAFLVAIIINLYVARPSVVSGRSMMPTLKNGDTIVISKLPYMLGDVEYGDIVVIDRQVKRERTFKVEIVESLKYNVLTQSLFDETELTEDTFWVKRIVGKPGDVIEFHEGKVYRNGEMLKESYIYTQSVTTYPEGQQYIVREGCVFVMGDNRNESMDSRALALSGEQIEIDHIVGKLISK